MKEPERLALRREIAARMEEDPSLRGLPARELAGRLGVGVSQAVKFKREMKGDGVAITTTPRKRYANAPIELEAFVRTEEARGMTTKEIGEKFGRSMTAVSDAWRRVWGEGKPQGRGRERASKEQMAALREFLGSDDSLDMLDTAIARRFGVHENTVERAWMDHYARIDSEEAEGQKVIAELATAGARPRADNGTRAEDGPRKPTPLNHHSVPDRIAIGNLQLANRLGFPCRCHRSVRDRESQRKFSPGRRESRGVVHKYRPMRERTPHL